MAVANLEREEEEEEENPSKRKSERKDFLSEGSASRLNPG